MSEVRFFFVFRCLFVLREMRHQAENCAVENAIVNAFWDIVFEVALILLVGSVLSSLFGWVVQRVVGDPDDAFDIERTPKKPAPRTISTEEFRKLIGMS